ncbi:MAG: lysylphosphatidylglycerol synthase transmembrane domain-containing protein [Chitinophagales bacterium]
MTKSKIVKFLSGSIGILISIALVWYIVKSYDLRQSWEIITSTSPWLYFSMVLVYLSTFYFRTLRWKLMLLNISKLNFGLLIKSIVLGFAGNNLIPARGGELLRMEYFSKKTKIGRTTSFASIVLEKILDASVLLFFLFCANLLLEARNEAIANTIKLASLFVLPVVLTLVILRIKGHIFIHRIQQNEHKIFKLLGSKLEEVYSALLFLKFDRRTIQVIVLSLMIWLLEGLVFIIGIQSIGIDQLVFPIGMIALCIVNFGILIPSSPGYIGVFQAAILIALGSFGISETDSLAAAIIIHSSQFIPITLIGLMIFLFEYFRNQQSIINKAT